MNNDTSPKYSNSKLYLQIFQENDNERFYKFLWTVNKYNELEFNKKYACHCICIGGNYHFLKINRGKDDYSKANDNGNRYRVLFYFEISGNSSSFSMQFKLKHHSNYGGYLEEMPFSAPNRKLEIICEMRLYQKKNCYPELFIPLLEVEQSYKVYKHIDEMFSSELFSDLSISVGEKLFSVHKAVLANRSKVFATMLEANMKEKAENKIVIQDCESDIFGEFLRYIYSNKLDLSNVKSALELYKLSEKYDLPDLELDTSIFLARNLNAENVIQLQKFADLHEDLKLKEATMDYMSQNLSEVMKSTDWSSFTSSTKDVDALFSILAKFVSEEKIYEEFRPVKK